MDNQVVAKRHELIARLHELTNNNALTWKVTPIDYGVQCAFADYVVRLGLANNGDTYMAVCDKDGKPMDTISAKELLTETGKLNSSDQLKELYKTARSQAHGVEQALDSILSTLSNL
ncbi:MAG: hypothetical protein V1806_02665 [Pseudomonadota bacterium]